MSWPKPPVSRTSPRSGVRAQMVRCRHCPDRHGGPMFEETEQAEKVPAKKE